MPEAQLLKLPMAGLASCGQHGRMHDMDALQSQDLRGLTPQALEALAQRMLVHVQQQAREIARRDGEIVWRDAKIEKITFELARLKRWKFGARTEAMDAQQRQLFLETLVEDEADLQAQPRQQGQGALNALVASLQHREGLLEPYGGGVESGQAGGRGHVGEQVEWQVV